MRGLDDNSMGIEEKMQGNKMEEEYNLGKETEGNPNQVQGEKRLK